MRDDVGFPLSLGNPCRHSPLCAAPSWQDRTVPSCRQSCPGDIALPGYPEILQRFLGELATLAGTLRAWKVPMRRYPLSPDRLLAVRELSLPGRKPFPDHQVGP